MKLVGKRLALQIRDEEFFAKIIKEEDFETGMSKKKITVLFYYDNTTKAELIYPEIIYKGFARFTSSVAQRAVEKEIKEIEEKTQKNLLVA